MKEYSVNRIEKVIENELLIKDISVFLYLGCAEIGFSYTGDEAEHAIMLGELEDIMERFGYDTLDSVEKEQTVTEDDEITIEYDIRFL